MELDPSECSFRPQLPKSDKTRVFSEVIKDIERRDAKIVAKTEKLIEKARKREEVQNPKALEASTKLL